MVTVNRNYLKLPGSYLFSTIAKKVSAYQAANPDVEIVPGLAELRRHREPEHPVIIGGSLQQQRAGRCVKDLHGPLLDLLASVEPTLDLYSIPIHKGEDIHAVRRSERGSGEYEAQRHAPKAKHTHIAIPWKIAGFPGGPWQ